MNIMNSQTNIPPAPIEDKPNTTLAKMLLVIAIIGGIGWYIHEKVNDGSIEQFLTSIEEALNESDDEYSEMTSDAQSVVEDYLAEKYNDKCSYAGKALGTLPEGASGGVFKCRNIADVDVYAYATEVDDEYEIEDGYLFAKYFWFTESSFANTIKLYFPSAEVKLVNSMYGISTNFNKDIPFINFVRNNGYNYIVRVELPRNTGININELTELSQHLAMEFPNFQVDASLVNTDESDPLISDSEHIFTIKCVDGKAGVTVNQ